MRLRREQVAQPPRKMPPAAVAGTGTGRDVRYRCSQTKAAGPRYVDKRYGSGSSSVQGTWRPGGVLCLSVFGAFEEGSLRTWLCFSLSGFPCFEHQHRGSTEPQLCRVCRYQFMVCADSVSGGICGMHVSGHSCLCVLRVRVSCVCVVYALSPAPSNGHRSMSQESTSPNRLKAFLIVLLLWPLSDCFRCLGIGSKIRTTVELQSVIRGDCWTPLPGSRFFLSELLAGLVSEVTPCATFVYEVRGVCPGVGAHACRCVY